MEFITTDKMRVVIGLGKSGYSIVAHLAKQGGPLVAMDTREQPPFADAVKGAFPDVRLVLGGLDEAILKQAAEIIVSPGLPLATPEIQAAKQAGVRVVGDIQLFAEQAKAPVIAITGSNAKSTVTTLVGEMAKAAGLKTAVGGNLGTPALELLSDAVQLYVMELSSFQLEATQGLCADVATVLNVSPDHLDRYDSYLAYHQAKHRIFQGAKAAVVNKDDSLSAPMAFDGMKQVRFGLGKPDLNEFGLVDYQESVWLAKNEQGVVKPLLDCRELKIKGLHNRSNALAALALGEQAGLPMNAMLETLREFPGLEHRCQWVADVDGVAYFNDSKGTNVGATEAALNGLGPDLNGKIVLLLGGDGKGAEFEFLTDSVQKHVKSIVAYGRDKAKIKVALQDTVSVLEADNFDGAIRMAREQAVQGDAVLLSPACASFDMFNNFEHRGDTFVAKVKAL